MGKNISATIVEGRVLTGSRSFVMIHRLSQNSWTLAVRGIIAILFGLVAFFLPVALLSVFVLVFGAYAFIDGILALIAAYRFAFEHERWLPMLVEGVIGVLVGVVVFVHPVAALITLVWVFGFWALFTGIMEIVAAFRLRRHVAGEWLLGLTGVISVILGLILLSHPVLAATAYVWVIGIYAMIAGVTMLLLAARLRSAASHINTDLPHTTAF